MLEPLVDFEIPDAATPADLAAAAAAALGWRPAAKLLRLEGFTGAWDRCLAAGKLLDERTSLVEAGVGEGCVITYVRIELVAEGWKVRCVGAGSPIQSACTFRLLRLSAPSLLVKTTQ